MASGTPSSNWRIHRNLLLFTAGFILFLVLMAWAEHAGLSRDWIGPIFLFLSVMLYACIGIYARTGDPEEFYVAGRRIPAMYNGMATAADWMSAASFISLAGALYLQGFSGTAAQPGGLAYVLGWTGGFCLVGLLIAPRLRAMKLYTVPDFFAVRFGGKWPRLLADPAAALAREREKLNERIRMLKAQGADLSLVMLARRELADLPRDVASARDVWTRAMNEAEERGRPLGGLPRHGQAFEGDPQGSPAEQALFNTSRLNFIALMFCLMVGTASLPHLLTRFYTTPTVSDTRRSVAWSLFFIALLYISSPALAVLVKFEVMQGLVGSSFDQLPNWIAQWARVDPALISVQDVNGDRVLQFGEIRLGADMIMLATPELGGLPYVVSALVAAGGLAAALSTADGLLLTISNALVHDTAPQDGHPTARLTDTRVILSKFALLAVAMLAALAAALKPAEIISLVTASFSLAAATFFPALVTGIFWPRATGRGVVAGMLIGTGLTAVYMLQASPMLRAWWGAAPGGLWWGIQPVSAGVFGVPAGFAAIVLVSLGDGWRQRSA